MIDQGLNSIKKTVKTGHETPNPEDKFPAPDKLPEVKSGVRGKKKLEFEDELLMEKVVSARGAIDVLTQAYLEIGDAKEWEPETKWEVIEKLIALSKFIAESENPDDLVKQSTRNTKLMEMYIATDKKIDEKTGKKMDKPIDSEIVEWFIRKAKTSIDKILADLENRKADLEKNNSDKTEVA